MMSFSHISIFAFVQQKDAFLTGIIFPEENSYLQKVHLRIASFYEETREQKSYARFEVVDAAACVIREFQ